jgi:hypothetical protein
LHFDSLRPEHVVLQREHASGRFVDVPHESN